MCTRSLLTSEQVATALDILHEWNPDITEQDILHFITDQIMDADYYADMRPDWLGHNLLALMAPEPWLRQHRPDMFMDDLALHPEVYDLPAISILFDTLNTTEFKRGDQVVYRPGPDAEPRFGFVTSVQEGGVAFVRFWNDMRSDVTDICDSTIIWTWYLRRYQLFPQDHIGRTLNRLGYSEQPA